MDNIPDELIDVMSLTQFSTDSCQFADKVHPQSSLITPAAELRLRNAAPNPLPQDNFNGCQDAEQSASRAIQQATQQASQSVQQAQQSASQAIQQASNDLSQSLQQASRALSSVQQSAFSAMSSLQASAASAIAEATNSAGEMAAAAQVAASRALVQAGGSRPTGNGGAAGSMFISRPSQSPNTSAGSNRAAPQERIPARSTGITPVQLAIAIVGSILVSTLISLLIFCLVVRHKKKAKARAASTSPIAEQGAPMEKSGYKGVRDSSSSMASLPYSPKAAGGLPTADFKRTSVAWNPKQPPRVPKIGGWLKAPEGVSPLGEIKLPTDKYDQGPLGGQLKSPMRSDYQKTTTRAAELDPFRDPPRKISAAQTIPTDVPRVILTHMGTVRKPLIATRAPSAIPAHMSHESRPISRISSNIWSDNAANSATTAAKNKPPVSATEIHGMQLPPSQGADRNTGEWLAAQQINTPVATPLVTPQISRYQLGVAMRPGPAVEIKTVKISKQKESLSRSGSLESNVSGTSDSKVPSTRKAVMPGEAL